MSVLAGFVTGVKKWDQSAPGAFDGNVPDTTAQDQTALYISALGIGLSLQSLAKPPASERQDAVDSVEVYSGDIPVDLEQLRRFVVQTDKYSVVFQLLRCDMRPKLVRGL